MFFLKHVLPLVIISVLIGYVIARVGLPPLDKRESASGSKPQITDVPPQAEAETVSREQGEILTRVREAASESSLADTTDDQNRYVSDVNSEIEEPVEKWSADRLLDQADTSRAPSKPQQHLQADASAGKSEPPPSPAAAEITAPEPPMVETATTEVTEPVSPSADETVATKDIDGIKTESGSPVAATSETKEPANAVAIAMAESPATVIDEALAAEDGTAEINEQSSARSPGTLTSMSLEDIIGARWSLGNEPAAPHLPSFITSCTQKGESFECWSGEYSAHAGSSARTKTKSIIRNGDTSGFTIRYRNMVTDPATKRSKWDQDVNQLDCAAQSQYRIRCIETDTGQEIVFTRVTGEQFPRLFTLSSLAATKWYSGGAPAEYLPSGTTRCDSEASGLVCWSNARTVQSADGSSSVKTKSLIRKTGDGAFLVTYRKLVTSDGQGAWEQDSHEAHCRVMGFERIVCQDEKGTRTYAKAEFTL